MTKSDTADIIVVDGRGVLWRSSYANSNLGYKGEDGWQPTGGVYGFIESVLSIAYRHPDASVYIAWEGGRTSHSPRRAIVSDYKKRDDKNEDRIKLAKLVIRQEAILKGLLKKTGWSQINAPGWEADDAIMALCLKSLDHGLQCLIVSGDADLFQCLEEPDEGWVRIHKPNGKKGTLWTVDRLQEEWGVESWQIPHVKALAGDASDNYRGVPGIGQKWACNLLKQYEDLDGVVKAAESDGKILNSKKKAEDLLANLDYVQKCLLVATINENAKTKLKPGDPKKNELRNSFRQLRFNSLTNDRSLDRLLQK